MNPSSEVLFSSDLWEKALEKFAGAAHMTVKLYDDKLRAVSGPIHNTPLFQLFDEIGYDPGIFVECARRCIVQTQDRPAVIVSQFHGLAVVGTSLLLEGKIVGAAVGGYVLADFSQVSEIQCLARQAGIGFEPLWEVARQQQPVPQNRLIVHGELLQVLGDALLRENYRTRQYAETAAIVASSDDAIISKDLHSIITSWNRGAEQIFGYTAREAVGQSVTMLIPADHVYEEAMILDRIRRGETVDHYETVRQRKDGTLLDISLTISPIRDAQGRIVGASKIARDITDRKRAEQALQRAHDELESLVQRRTASLRRLTSRLQHVQDEERRKMARELHDSAGQYLAAVKMNLAQLDQAGLSKSKSAIVAESEQLIDKCLAEIRTVSYLLHPPLLDESGLASAARFYIEGFARRSNIKVNLDISSRLERMSQPVEMVLFRALQENLTNVHRHSGSPNVDIRIDVQDGQATLAVRDFGRGVAPEQLESFEKGTDRGVGLAGMRERVSEFGGTLEILPKDPGTLVKLTLPVGQKQAGTISSKEHSETRGSAA